MTESSPELRALLRQARTAYSPSRGELEAVLVELETHAAVNLHPSSGAASWSHVFRWLGLGVVVMGAVGAAWHLQKPAPALTHTVQLSAPPKSSLPQPVAPSMPVPSAQATASASPPTAANGSPRADTASKARPVKARSTVASRVATRAAPEAIATVTRTERTTTQLNTPPAYAGASNVSAAAETAAERAQSQSDVAPSADTGEAQPIVAAKTAPEPKRMQSEPDTLMLELPLLRGAQAALNRGQAAEALALLERHTMRYPTGVLRQERIAAQVSALCMLGRVREATQFVQQLARIAPASPHLLKLENSCVRDGAR